MDVRYHITEHDTIECLHVTIDVHEAGTVLPTVEEGVAHAYIPIDDILRAIINYRSTTDQQRSPRPR